jgi:hypothetical protein
MAFLRVQTFVSRRNVMKIAKSLILILVLAGAVFAGEMPQVGPAPTPSPTQPQPESTGKIAEILVAIAQNLMSLR